MFYILKDKQSYNKKPEIDYGSGTTMSFQKGWFLFDTDNTDKNYWENKDSNQIDIDSTRYSTQSHLIQSNRNKAEIMFYQLKLDEMKDNGFEFFMPFTFERYKEEAKRLIAEYPEYTI